MITGGSVPAVPFCVLDPIRDQFPALLPAREDRHPWGCHNPRVSDAVVFDRLVQVLVLGCGYERAAEQLCSATTPRRRRGGLSLDAGYDSSMVHQDLHTRRITGKIAGRGAKTPIRTGGRWVVERTNSWMNNFGKLRRRTGRRKAPIKFFTALASTIITVRCLIRRAWTLYRWDTRPQTPHIR